MLEKGFFLGFDQSIEVIYFWGRGQRAIFGVLYPSIQAILSLRGIFWLFSTPQRVKVRFRGVYFGRFLPLKKQMLGLGWYILAIFYPSKSESWI